MPTSDQYTQRRDQARDRVGFARWFVRPDSIRGATDHISAPTRRGAVNVTLWISGFLTIGWVGRVVTGLPGSIWFLITLAIMVFVGLRWPPDVERRP